VAFVELKVRVELPCPAVNVAGLAVNVAVGAGVAADVDPPPDPAELQPARMLSPKSIPPIFICCRVIGFDGEAGGRILSPNAIFWNGPSVRGNAGRIVGANFLHFADDLRLYS
jgi:hypothetical protein